MARRWHRRRFFVCNYNPSPPPTCMIWGYESDSEIDADHNQIDFLMKRGRIFGRWFSRYCTDGEVGTHGINDLTQITEEDFEKAMKAIKVNWKLKTAE